MTRDDLFNTNASIVRDIAECCSKVCPTAVLGVITNPVSTSVTSKTGSLMGPGTFCVWLSLLLGFTITHLIDIL